MHPRPSEMHNEHNVGAARRRDTDADTRTRTDADDNGNDNACQRRRHLRGVTERWSEICEM